MTTAGMDRTLARLGRMTQMGRGYSVRVNTQSTQGSIHLAKGGSQDVSRNAVQNLIVIRTQAKAGRNIQYLTDAELAEVTRLWQEGILALEHGGGLDPLPGASKQVGEFLRAAFARHVEAGENIKPVTESTRKRKLREVGSEKVPLVRTGQLLGAFITSARKL